MDEVNGKEFSRIVAVERINNISAEYNIEANQKEREELSLRFGIVSMKCLKAHFIISRSEENSGYLIKGKVFSELVQSCSVTLVDVPATLEVMVVIACKQRAIQSGTAAHLLDLEEDDIECIDENGCVDIGEITSQYLSLDLDPYPRVAGLPILEEGKDEPNDESDVINPFLVLQKLKK